MIEARDCLRPDEALDLIDHRLGDDAARAIDQHLDGCDACRRVVAAAAHSGDETPTTGAGGAIEAARGERVGRYVLVEPIGRGGMGVVFRARDETLDRDVAVKLIHLDGPEAKRRAEREARALARLSHPNVVAVYDAGEHGDATFLAMELVAGRAMNRWLDDLPRSIAEVLAVIGDVARGLAAAHAVGLIHRDVKPGNILVGDDGRSRIADFGLARTASAAGGLVGGPRDGTGIAGTILYMAPEQLRGDAVSARCDQFALAVTAWEALYRQAPFASDSAEERLAAIEEARVIDPPAARRVEVGDAIERTLRRALDVKPARRFHDLRGFAAALTPSPRRRWQRAAIAAGLVAVAGIATWRVQAAVDTRVHPALDSDAVNAARLADGKRELAAGGAAMATYDYESAQRHWDEMIAAMPQPGLVWTVATGFREFGELARARHFFVEYERLVGDGPEHAKADAEIAKLDEALASKP